MASTLNSSNESRNDWTIMYFFASDNELAPLIISQFKSIKDAGFQKNTEIVVHFDPREKGIPSRVFNVNAQRKKSAKQDKKTHIGDVTTLIPNMQEDEEIISSSASSRGANDGPTSGATELPAPLALGEFLKHCAQNYPANHYMLFLVGHGMIVGNDNFLPDEDPVSSITLLQLDEILIEFNAVSGGTLELLALHSCSMSGIEVAYQLQDKAKYMIASEGMSFVGSWPYRRLMMTAFKAIEDGKAQAPTDIATLVDKLYSLSFENASDYFSLSGYPVDLSLCSLDSENFAPNNNDPENPKGLSPSLQNLVESLRKGLTDPRTNELIRLAHLESQSYWGESYTDLHDFCSCLAARCNKYAPPEEISAAQKAIKVDCERVIASLDAVVLRSKFAGWQSQFSRGLSIYFPWAAPLDQKILPRYAEYAFSTGFATEQSWLSFLKVYFNETRRPREAVAAAAGASNSARSVIPSKKMAAAAGVGGNVSGLFARRLAGALDRGDDKTTGSTGAGCSCASIKNYQID